MAVLLPDSRRWTWQFTPGDFGSDLDFIDAALALTFERVPVDPTRIALAGFSAGGSIALSLGPSNGDLFRWVMAFSPTGIVVIGMEGHPRFFVAHGTLDEVAPIAIDQPGHRARAPGCRGHGRVPGVPGASRDATACASTRRSRSSSRSDARQDFFMMPRKPSTGEACRPGFVGR